MRLLFVPVLLALPACGTVCDGVVGAERSTKARAFDCNVTVTVHDANKCNTNLSKCTGEDLKALQDYTSCLNALPNCSASNQGAFQSSLNDCGLKALTKLTLSCWTSIL